MVLDVTFANIADPADLEKTLNNIPGVLENGIFVDLANVVLIGEIQDGQPVVREM
jgi:ribose 5-phosphate isomerase A